MMGDLASCSFEGYLSVTKWNTTIDERKQKKLLEIMEMTQRIEVHQKVLVHLAKNPTPGRLITIYWVRE